MKLRKKLPPNRSYEQVKNHHLVEKDLAAKLNESTYSELADLLREQGYTTIECY